MKPRSSIAHNRGKARTILLMALTACAFFALTGCERRIVRKEEISFIDYAEKNWRKLTPRQKANYYEMIERQKERAARQR
ncbi:MAG: hypothetical protein NTZ78_03860 [Candidatus Aureabacteria bacterium]|nr:hypothetical protein [Candidatus Auribacterota bacterium]